MKPSDAIDSGMSSH